MFAAPPKRHSAEISALNVPRAHDNETNSVSYAMYIPGASDPHQKQLYQRQNIAKPNGIAPKMQSNATIRVGQQPFALRDAVNVNRSQSSLIVGAAPNVPPLASVRDTQAQQQTNQQLHQQKDHLRVVSQQPVPAPVTNRPEYVVAHENNALDAFSEAEHPPFPEEQRYTTQPVAARPNIAAQFDNVHNHRMSAANPKYNNGVTGGTRSPEQQESLAQSETEKYLQRESAASAESSPQSEQENVVDDTRSEQADNERRNDRRRRRKHRHRSASKHKASSSDQRKGGKTPTAHWSRRTKHIVFVFVSAVVSALAVFVLLALTNPTFVQRNLPENVDSGSVQAPLDMRKAAVLAGVAGAATLAMPFLWRHCAPHAASYLPWKL